MALNKLSVLVPHVGTCGSMANSAKCFPFIHPKRWTAEERRGEKDANHFWLRVYQGESLQYWLWK